MQHIKLFEEYHNSKVELNNFDVKMEGEVQLYHYTKTDLGDKTILSPEESFANRLPWSMREYKRSDVPRVFYYTNLEKTEHSIVSLSKFLYTGFVNGSDIIKVSNAIIDYRKNTQELELQFPDVYHSVKEFVDKGSMNYDILFESVKKYFKGAYYKFENGMEVVILFQPLEVYKIDFVKYKE